MQKFKFLHPQALLSPFTKKKTPKNKKQKTAGAGWGRRLKFLTLIVLHPYSDEEETDAPLWKLLRKL